MVRNEFPPTRTLPLGVPGAWSREQDSSPYSAEGSSTPLAPAAKDGDGNGTRRTRRSLSRKDPPTTSRRRGTHGGGTDWDSKWWTSVTIVIG